MVLLFARFGFNWIIEFNVDSVDTQLIMISVMIHTYIYRHIESGERGEVQTINK